MRNFIWLIFLLLTVSVSLEAQDHASEHADTQSLDTDQAEHAADQHHDDESHDTHAGLCAHESHPTEFDPASTAYHHIADANVYSIGPWAFPLPCILYAPGQGWDIFMSSKFDIGHHGTGHYAYRGYVLDGGSVKRVADTNFTKEKVAIDGITHEHEMIDGKERLVAYMCYGGSKYKLDAKSTADGGLFGGGVTSYYDFSITKNVTAMIMVFLFLLWMFMKIAKAYRNRDGMAPKGIQSFIEPIFTFIQDDVSKAFLGNKWEKYNPFIMSLFFFILALNLFGQIPFLGGANVTGNLAVTMVLALLAFIVTTVSGNKHYWEHIFWMPGVPAWVKTILTPVEFLGVFIKPVTLLLRLFANITAGHMVVIIFVSLIFIFGQNGTLPGAAYGASIGSILLTLFMMAIELLVAFIQAFVFAILTASYIGAATEEHH